MKKVCSSLNSGRDYIENQDVVVIKEDSSMSPTSLNKDKNG